MKKSYINRLLLRAIKRCDKIKIEQLIEYGAQIEKIPALYHAVGTGQCEIVEFVLTKTPDIDKSVVVDSIEITPLTHAIIKRYHDIAKLLLFNSATITKEAHDHKISDFARAIINDDIAMMQLLLHYNAYLLSDHLIDTQRESTTSPYWVIKTRAYRLLKKAIEHKNLEVTTLITTCFKECIKISDLVYFLNTSVEFNTIALVRYFINYGVDVDGFDHYEETPLHIAIRHNHVDMVDYLICNGANVNITKSFNADKTDTPLWYAVEKDNINIIMRLLAHQACVTLPIVKRSKNPITRRLLLSHFTPSPYTLLHKAAYDGDLQWLINLLGTSDINANTPYIGTPLCEAVYNGHYEIVLTLLNHGAEMMRSDFSQWALNQAVEKSHYDIAKLLIARGANVNNPLQYVKATPLQLAARYGDVAIVGLLLEHGADTTIETLSFTFPLGEAARHGHTAVVRILLNYGANVSQQGYFNDETALHLASKSLGWQDYSEIIMLLYQHGAIIDACNNYYQQTPLHLAVYYGNLTAAITLLNINNTKQLTCKRRDYLFANDNCQKTVFDYVKKNLTYYLGDPIKFNSRQWAQVQKKIYLALRLQELLLSLPNEHEDTMLPAFSLTSIFKQVFVKGFDTLSNSQLNYLYKQKDSTDIIGQFVREFIDEIKVANQLVTYAKGPYSFFQRALRTAGLPAEIASHIAQFTKEDDLPTTRFIS